jgi:adenylate cyclase
MFCWLGEMPPVELGVSPERFLPAGCATLESVRLVQVGTDLAIPDDERLAALIPFRRPGGLAGGSFHCIAAVNLLARVRNIGPNARDLWPRCIA